MSAACPANAIGNAHGIADGLRLVDCMAGEATADAFGRLFGAGGALLPALTILLTLYVAVMAIGMLTGRGPSLSSLSPRAMTFGLVLTFATSWVAYQNVVWNLAVGAPDQVASVLLDTRGSATVAFADRVDILFRGIADAIDEPTAAQAQAATQPVATSGPAAGAPPATVAAYAAGGHQEKIGGGVFSPTDLTWLSALMLLLGTVGVLVTAKIVLAVLLAVGPVFIVMALFGGTRGLFEGWLKGVVMFATVPLFTVLLGAGVLEVAAPVVGMLHGPEGLQPRAVVTLFLIAAVFVALTVMALKVATTLVTGWRLHAAPEAARASATSSANSTAPPVPLGGSAAAPPPVGERARTMLAALPMPANDGGLRGEIARGRDAAVVGQMIQASPSPHGARAGDRLRGLGSRFRAAPQPSFKETRP